MKRQVKSPLNNTMTAKAGTTGPEGFPRHRLLGIADRYYLICCLCGNICPASESERTAVEGGI